MPHAVQPHVYYALRLGVRSEAGGWERELDMPQLFHQCEQEPPELFWQCITEVPERSKGWTMHNAHFPDLSADFGRMDAPGFSTNIQLFVYGWHRSVSLASMLQGALRAPPAVPGTVAGNAGTSSGWGVRQRGPPPSFYVALPYFVFFDLERLALLMEWNVAHHLAMGFDGVILYVLGKHVPVLGSHPTIRRLAQAGSLRLVVWDEMAWLEGWKDFEHKLENAHSVLSFWGTNTRLLILDPDEFLVPGQRGATVQDMLGEGGFLADPATSPDTGCHYLRR